MASCSIFREYTWSQLDKNDINFLKKFPDKTVKNIDGLKLYFSHGSPRSIYEYIKPETSKKQIKEMIMNLDADFIFVGHSHIPLVEYIGKKTIINPGAVGQPRDSDNRASCALFDTISQKVEVIRCEYDIKNVYKKIQNNMPYPDQIIEILERGY